MGDVIPSRNGSGTSVWATTKRAQELFKLGAVAGNKVAVRYSVEVCASY